MIAACYMRSNSADAAHAEQHLLLTQLLWDPKKQTLDHELNTVLRFTLNYTNYIHFIKLCFNSCIKPYRDFGLISINSAVLQMSILLDATTRSW